ncbi:hypothetical protein [Streptomyces albidoflavus]|uniref:hypothetical protein n=1 Tax=Streptomyces albidoflavus TaxID=1886 RepID=UPI000525F82E|nr:hypothetical protein [Streptomyces albidoflavus]
MTHPNPLTLTTTDIHTLRTALNTIAPDDTAILRQQLAGALAELDLYRQWLTYRTQQLADAHDLIHHLTHPETSA